jgi:hypothetical protein
MANSTAPAISASAEKAKPRGRALVTLFSLISLVTIFLLDLYAGGDSKGGPLISTPFWLPYLFVILRLRKRPKSALALAITMSCAMAGPAVWLILYARSWDARWWIPSGLAVVAMAQLALAVIAVRSWRNMPSEPGQWRVIIANATYGVIALIILIWVLRDMPNRITENENGTVWLLQDVHKAAASYASTYGGVYPAHLTAFDASPGDSAPTCNAASLLSLPLSPSDPDSFQGRGWGGEYVFEYFAGSPAKSSAGCVGAARYTLRARPVVYRRTGRRSFLIDETGVIHATGENRPARVGDPAIQSSK